MALLSIAPNRLLLSLVCVPLLVALSAMPQNAVAFPFQDQAELTIAQTAFTAQSSGEYQFAADEWERLITRFPKSESVAKARFNAGVCRMYSSNYEKAIEHFKTALPNLDESAVRKLEAGLFLGFSQYRLGQELIDNGEKEKANLQLTTATQTLEKLAKENPTFVDLDQAYYYQGEAYNELDRLDEALAAYTKMLACPKKTVRMEGLYAKGDVHDRLGQHAKALELFETFQKESAAVGGNPYDDEVKMRTGATLVQLAESDQDAGNKDAATQKLQRAAQLLTEVTQVDPQGKSSNFPQIIEEAKFELAFATSMQGEHEKAAGLYEELAANSESRYAQESLANAGRNYLNANNLDKAVPLLNKTMESNSKFSDVAAHLLASKYLELKQPQKAYDVTTKQLANLSGEPRVTLKLDQAESAYQIPERLAESAKLFQAIADDHADHDDAPLALRNVAFAKIDLKDYPGTVEVADQFEKRYPENEYLPVALELKAEALLLDGQHKKAITAYDYLVSKFSDHTNLAFWKLRCGLSKFMAEDYQGAIDQITPVVNQFELAERKAESHFWIGSSQFSLEKFSEAVTSFTNSNAADQKWKRADENLLMLCRSQLKSNQLDQAQQTAVALKSGFPESSKLADLHFYLGESAYDTEKFDEAMTNFQSVIDQHGKTRFAPLAIYKAALTQAKLSKFEDSEKLFSKLISEFGDHELAKEAKVERGAMRLKSGDAKSSLVDLKAFLETNPTGTERYKTLYRIGVAQIELKEWDDAITTLKGLTDEAADSPRIDNFWYDLAWAYKYRKLESEDAEDLSVDYFKKIADQKPGSKLAGESNFHIGSAAYDSEKFNEAADAFRKSFESETSAGVREKAAYKLGWSHYKQDQFAQAKTSFENQAKAFPEGDLVGDGAFMVAESSFRQKKYEEAYQGYVKAKPMVMNSDSIQSNVKALTLLHGSQAANKVKKYNEAVGLAKELTDSSFDESYKLDAWLELGTARQGLGQSEDAIKAWEKAGSSLSKTGARALCMIGDQYFKEKKFDEAIRQFKLVYFGFGGPQSAKEIQAWQAYAVYEAARCHFVQMGKEGIEPGLKTKLKGEAIKAFSYLLKHYPEDLLAPEAKRQLDALNKM